MRVFLRCSTVWPIHDRSLALSPLLLAHSCSAMTREYALRIGVCGSSRGSDSRPSGRVGKFRAFCRADLKSNCPLMAAMLVARIESRGPKTVGISGNTKVSGPRPIRPESCRPVPSPKNRVTAHP